jgi:RNA polymerase sigma factor (sigma-70 family)
MIQGAEDRSNDGIFARAQAGDPAAWEELFRLCHPKLVRVVRRKLTSPAMRSLYDSIDFANDAWKSLVAKSDRFDFPTIGHLMAFLSQVAQHKVIDAHRRLRSLRGGEGRERPIESGSEQRGSREPPSNEPPASQVAIVDEILDMLRSDLDEPRRTVIELKRLGYSTEEIATRVGWERRKVQRFLKDLHDSRLRTATEAAPERESDPACPQIARRRIDLRGEDRGEDTQRRDESTASPPREQQESRHDGGGYPVSGAILR